MSNNIYLELLKKIKNEFNLRFIDNKKIEKLNQLLFDRKATYQEANELAVEVGKILKNVFGENITENILENGVLTEEIANILIRPNMMRNYDIVSTYSTDVQQLLNRQSDIGLKAMKPPINKDRIDGIVKKIAEKEFNDTKWLLGEPIINFTQSVVDDTIRHNTELQYKSGLKPKIKRKEFGKCCDWCRQVVGEYEYPDVPDNVYKRHRYCRCTVEYLPGNGKAQDVWSKKWKNIGESDKIKERIKLSNQRKDYQFADDKIEKQLLKESDKNWKKLLGSEQNTMYEYSGSAYDIINKYLRGVTTEEDAEDIEYYQVKRKIKEIDRVLSRNKLGQDLVLYRGVSSEEFTYWLNANVIDTYKSTSISEKTFDYFGDGHRIVIHAPKNTKGFYIGNHSNYKSEKEFLIHRG